MSNQLSTRVDGIRTTLAERQDKLFAAAASHVRPERFIEQVARACINNPQLLECDQKSLLFSVSEAATLGLEIDNVLGHAYLVPFKNRKKGITEATLIPGYLGLKELAYNSGRIAALEFGVVHQDDEFDYEKGTEQYLRHRPKDDASDGQVTHVYALIRTTTGGKIFDVMSWPKVEAHRNKFAKGWQRPDSAWQTNPVAMALKTVLRKALKLAPLSAETQRLMQREELVEQPQFASGDEAPTEDLDAIDALDGGEASACEPATGEPTEEEKRQIEAEESKAAQEWEAAYHGAEAPKPRQEEIPF